MRLRGPAGLLAATVLATVLQVVLVADPAFAAGPCTVNADEATADYYPDPSPWSDGTKVRFRVLHPTGGVSCPSKPAAGWPLIVDLHGGSGNRCFNQRFAARSEMASYGYAVLSFTARGRPLPLNIGSGSVGCDEVDDGYDALDDGGAGYNWSRDKQDISQLIDWVRDNYAPTGCSTNCVDTGNVGIVGVSWGGLRAWTMGVGNPPNPDFDDRIKAIAPFAAQVFWLNLAKLSSDGDTTPTARPAALGTWGNVVWWGNQGWFGHWEREFSKHTSALERAAYLNLPVPPDTDNFWDERVVIDDDPAVDKIDDIDVPTFVMAGWLDGSQGIFNEVAIEAFEGLSGSDKYLYLGSCSHSPDPCHDPNADKMRDALVRFFDKYLKNDATPVGGPIFYTIPPKYTDASNNPWLPTGQTWTESTASTWPPVGSVTYPLYLRDDGTLDTMPEVGTTCAAPTGCKEIANNLNDQAPVEDFCDDATYGAGESQTYETAAFSGDGKVGRIEADLYMSTDTTRLQVYVDVFDVIPGTPETEVRIWQGQAQVAPVERNATPGQVYRFAFRPGGAAWTIAGGHKFRIKVTSKYEQAFPPEYLPGTYTVHHNATHPSNVKVTFVP